MRASVGDAGLVLVKLAQYMVSNNSGKQRTAIGYGMNGPNDLVLACASFLGFAGTLSIADLRNPLNANVEIVVPR